MTAIRLDGLTKYYGDIRGVEDLTFEVREGEVFGFLGPNGAGKTTAIRTLMGFQSATAGEASVLGADIGDAEALRSARRDIGYLPSDPGLDESITGRRLLDYHGSLRGDSRSEELLKLFDPPLDRKVGQYSRGNKQMLAIIVAFMHDPELVFMDEPTSGLDPLKQEELLGFMEAERDRGKTFFFSSHVLSEVRKVCDRVGIIRDGHLVELEAIDSLLDRTGKIVRASVGDTVSQADVSLDGAHDVSVSGGDGSDETMMSFTYTGAYDSLLRHLLEYDLRDLSIEEAPLEDVFMRFYDDDPQAAVEQVEGEQAGEGAGKQPDEDERAGERGGESADV